MKIWLVGACASPEIVNGINSVVWLLAGKQAQLGHEVTLLLDEQPSKHTLATAKETGVKLVHVPATAWRFNPQLLKSLLSSDTPDIVHMQSVFIPAQAELALRLVRKKIPYVITPHGGVAPQVLARHKAKKFIYSLLIEKPRFSQASAITLVTPAEEREVRAFAPRYKGIVRSIPNPVDSDLLKGLTTRNRSNIKRIVYLGRFDVLHKGIDILIDIARFLPEVEFRLYGTDDPRTKKWLTQLKANKPPNVSFHRPIFGAEKIDILTSASLYLQTSRWEASPMSVAESMYLGVPCAISDIHNLAELFRREDLGLLLPRNPKEAAIELERAMVDQKRLQGWAERSRAFALSHFNSASVARSYLDLYEEVLIV